MSRAMFFAWSGVLLLILLFVAVTKLFPDAKTRELRHAPGMDLVFIIMVRSSNRSGRQVVLRL